MAGVWKVDAVRPKMLEVARAPASSEAVRAAAVEGLAALGGSASRETLEQLSAAGPAALRRTAVTALADLDPAAAARHAVDLLAAADSGDPATLFDGILQRKNGGSSLATALAGKKLPADVAKIGIRSVRTSARDLPALVEALTTAGGLTTSGLRMLSPEQMREAVAEVTQKGDAVRGEAVFRRKDLLCLKCHAIAGAGGQVGPDLTSIGASAQVDYLVDSLLQPNKAVKEGYHATLVTTKAGKLFTGIKLKQTSTEVVLRGADDAEVAIPVREIEEQTLAGSLMPDGLTDSLTRSEFADLVRFLSELGKVGAYAPSKARLVRRWQVLESNPATTEAVRAGGLVGAIQDGRLIWSPAYSTVAGALPTADLPGVGAAKLGVVRCQLDATAGGRVLLRLNGGKGLTAWLDRTPVEVREATEVTVPPGTHTLTFSVDARSHGDALRVELDDVPGSPARVRVLGGK
jgi:putative heme-binding domain-containing protein